ncbi:MAG: AAA family ATPase [Bacteroidota bacterium]|nr:AAA family ATPase [Bacteroidota bacterium]
MATKDIFIKSISVNKVRHLKDFTIPISENERKHLILTGKNGSGKTSLLEAIKNYLTLIPKDAIIEFSDWKSIRVYYENRFNEIKNKIEKELKFNSAYTAFKIWIIKNNKKLNREFKPLIPKIENQ